MLKELLKYCTIILFTLFFLSCEKEVNFNLGDGDKKVVIEGSIETGQVPFVRLTNSIGFFSKIDLSQLADAYIHDAIVTVSDGITSIQLKEYILEQDGFSLSFYTVDTDDAVARNFVGEVGKTYDLEVHVAGEVFTASTQILAPVMIDSIWQVYPDTTFGPLDNPDLREVWIQYQDPLERGNKFRYFVERNDEGFLPPFYSVSDDDLNNGILVQIALSGGVEKLDTASRRNAGLYLPGDVVNIKWCSIDEGSFYFWRTLEFAVGSVGNPFGTPVEVTSNIKGGALGVWCGYGVSSKQIIIE